MHRVSEKNVLYLIPKKPESVFLIFGLQYSNNPGFWKQL